MSGTAVPDFAGKKWPKDYPHGLPQKLEDYQSRIRKRTDLNAYIELFDEARKDAARIQEKINCKKAGLLAGTIIGLKDNIAYQDHLLTASSSILQNYRSPFSASLTERLLAEDALIIGRHNCGEFAMGSDSSNSFYGPVLNPHNTEFDCGGSSSGSASAVAAGLCDVAIGTDTGGSVRQPASYCGIFALKPTYGRISRYGIIEHAGSFDQAGILSAHPDDIAKVLHVISGADGKDATASEHPKPEFHLKPCTKHANILVYSNLLQLPGVHKEVRDAFYAFVRKLEKAGHKIHFADFKQTQEMLSAYQVLTSVEAASNLARYDGILYGNQQYDESGKANIRQTRSKGFGLLVKQKIMLGTYIAEKRADLLFAAASFRRSLRESALLQFEKMDFILSPTTPAPSFRIGSLPSYDDMFLLDLFLIQANLCGIPALSFPAGHTKNGLPFGFQLMAADFQEEKLMSFVNDYCNL